MSDQVKGYAINIAQEGFQCFNDSKQLLFSDVIDLLSRRYFPRSKSNRPTLLEERSTKTKPRSITQQVKDGAAF